MRLAAKIPFADIFCLLSKITRAYSAGGKPISGERYYTPGAALGAKLALAFAVSSFYCGIADAMWAFIYTGGVEPLAFDIDRSFQILFMIIIGGLGSILGSFLGAGF